MLNLVDGIENVFVEESSNFIDVFNISGRRLNVRIVTQCGFFECALILLRSLLLDSLVVVRACFLGQLKVIVGNKSVLHSCGKVVV